MTWRGSTTPLNRLFASFPYLLPLMDAIFFFSRPFFSQFPALEIILLPLAPLLQIYSAILMGIPFAGFIIFIALFMLVVRNENIGHFIRFNAMQSIIIGIALSLFGIIWSYVLQPIISGGLIVDTFFNVVFLGTVAAVVYSIAQCVLGRYAEIPTLSEAAYAQVR